MPQAQTGNGTTPSLLHSSQINLLITEAKAAGTPIGAQAYCDHLTKMFVDNQAGNAYITALSRRLAMAELMARQGKRVWILESSVAQGFNDLMNRVTEPSGKPLQTDTSVVHQLRLSLYNVSPHLSSVDSHNSECPPSEAVLVMYQLLANNGAACLPCPPRERSQSEGSYVTGCVRDVDAQSLIFRYAASHSRPESVSLYEHLVRFLGF